MSLNNVLLTPQLIADLYRHSLVETHATDVPVSGNFKHLGNNGKNILIIVHDTMVAYLSESDLTFLTTVLNACKLGLADVAIINTATQPINDYHDVIKHFNSNVVLLFGIQPSAFGLPFEFPAFQIQRFEGQSYLHTPPLSDVAASKTLKGQLWNSLKQIFGI